MICRSCLRRTGTLRPSLSTPYRTFTSSNTLLDPTPTSTSPVREIVLKPKPIPKASATPISSCTAGTILKGINYLKGRDEPVALPDEEYPEWLWRVLDVKQNAGEGEQDADNADEFSKSKKIRRKAAKRQRKLEAKLLASGNMDALIPKVPITQQSIDLSSNEAGTLEGAMEAVRAREDIRSAMRRERRKAIKQNNYLKGM